MSSPSYSKTVPKQRIVKQSGNKSLFVFISESRNTPNYAKGLIMNLRHCYVLVLVLVVTKDVIKVMRRNNKVGEKSDSNKLIID